LQTGKVRRHFTPGRDVSHLSLINVTDHPYNLTMSAPPKVLSRKANGVTPTQVSQPLNDTPKSHRTKPPAEGEKVVIRRLPPGMTEEECIGILGDAWKVGNGKVDWFSYSPGKVSTQ